MKITVIGSGYVGLVSGACFAELGNDVFCLDVDARKIEMLNAGGVPIYEPGLAALIERNRAAGRLQFSTDVAASVAHADVQFIAVGTPPDEDGSADLQYVLAAARNIAAHMTDFKLVVDKSTVPVGTAHEVQAEIGRELARRGEHIDFCVASNPEFLKEGMAVDDFMKPDRIIIGTDSERATELLRKIYAPFHRKRDRLIVMDVRSAELTKYAANAMLATRISFMNELANLSEILGADVEMVRQGIGSDPRIGYDFLFPGCGYGGSCFPKDVSALCYTALQNGVSLKVLNAVDQANDHQKGILVDKVSARFGANLKGKHFALWGLAFKPNTDDMREAPSRAVLENLWSMGATVAAYDPAAMDEARRIYGERKDLQLATSAVNALNGADALLIVTEWKEFRSPDFSLMKSLLRSPIVFDGRNLYDPTQIRGQGLEYFPIGR